VIFPVRTCGEVESVGECLPEEGVSEELLVIAKGDEADVVDVGERVDVEVGDAQEKRRTDRKKEEESDQYERGREEVPSGARLRALWASSHRLASRVAVR